MKKYGVAPIDIVREFPQSFLYGMLDKALQLRETRAKYAIEEARDKILDGARYTDRLHLQEIIRQQKVELENANIIRVNNIKTVSQDAIPACELVAAMTVDQFFSFQHKALESQRKATEEEIELHRAKLDTSCSGDIEKLRIYIAEQREILSHLNYCQKNPPSMEDFLYGYVGAGRCVTFLRDCQACADDIVPPQIIDAV